MKKTTFLVITAIICTLSACKCPCQKGMTKAEVENEITDKYWKLVELRGVAVESTAHIIFRADGRVDGNLGCNTFNGVYALQEGNRIKFDNLVNTQKMCIANMDIEDGLRSVLQMADNYNFTDKQFVLNRARMAPLARFDVVYMK